MPSVTLSGVGSPSVRTPTDLLVEPRTLRMALVSSTSSVRLLQRTVPVVVELSRAVLGHYSVEQTRPRDIDVPGALHPPNGVL